MKLKNLIRDYFSFTQKERVGLLFITGLIIFLWSLPTIMDQFSDPASSVADTSWVSEMRKLEARPTDPQTREENEENDPSQYNYSSQNKNRKEIPAELFSFDPNTVSEEGWLKLGIRPKTVKTIKNYLSKGGLFRSAEDLRKIYGLSAADFTRIAPYVRIEFKKETPTGDPSYPDNLQKKMYAPRKEVRISDINTADSASFIALPGIGSKLAVRIIHFREKLGGFYSVAQLKEIYGLPDSTFQRIKPLLDLDPSLVKKLNINTATSDELKNHPYIKWNLANAIVEFRNRHGLYSGLEELKKIILIDEITFEKIRPYLTL